MGDEKLHQLAPDAFDNAGIWYKQLSGYRFEFKLKDKRKVESIIGRLYQKTVPSYRSVSFGPEMEAIVVRKFRENSIKYDVRQFQGDRWVVWSETGSSVITPMDQLLPQNQMTYRVRCYWHQSLSLAFRHTYSLTITKTRKVPF
ncbi:MAG: hypothetical protein GY781_18765 [Gammaproteobacteria bacterium]|nr:hypothetical protein [Gammaproteobacteria bacterium]